MKKPSTLALALALGMLTGVHALRADETLRRAQQALRDQGFYYGPIDGASGDETTQAVRRYQIRNGLAVSGKLNDETLRSLQINAAAPNESSAPSSGAPPRPTPRAEPTPPALSGPVPPVLSGRSGKKEPTPAPAPRSTPAAPPPTYSRPDLRAGSPDATPGATRLPRGAQLPSANLTEFFSATPYEFAPPAIQADIVRRAQNMLGREGFYTGAPDGAPGPMTAQALSNFQGALRLSRTGRLDETTLRAMRLMPGPGLTPPPAVSSRRERPRTESPSARRGRPEPDLDDDDDDGPPVRVQRLPRRPPVFEGRIVE